MEEIKENYAWDDGDEYAFGEEVEFSIPEIKHNIWPRSNQWSNIETSSACTMIGALNQIIRLFGIDLTTKESNKLWIEVVHYCEQFWYKIGGGWSTPTAINSVCKFWNEIGAERYGTEKVFYARRYWDTDKPQEALKKGHLVGFTMNLNFGEDRRKGLVDKDKYPGAWGHRLNWQSTKTTVPTGWAKCPEADCGVYDNYYWLTNQYLILDRSKYINKWMYAWGYLILPQSCLEKSVEENKEEIKRRKALNYVVMALSMAYQSVPEKYQQEFSKLAKEIRDGNPDVRKLIEGEDEKKGAIAITDALSYLYKFADEEDKKKYAEMASNMRKKYWFE